MPGQRHLKVRRGAGRGDEGPCLGAQFQPEFHPHLVRSVGHGTQPRDQRLRGLAGTRLMACSKVCEASAVTWRSPSPRVTAPPAGSLVDLDQHAPAVL